MAGTAETRKGAGGALQARRLTDRPDSQSAGTIDRDGQPISKSGRRK